MNEDMVTMAWDVANDEADYPTGRRLFQHDDEVGDGAAALLPTARAAETEAAAFLSALDDAGRVAGLAAARSADASVHSHHALSSRALSESGSGEEEDLAERSRTAGGRFSTMFLYLAKEGVDDILTAPILKQMCEVENSVLGSDDYGKVSTGTLPLMVHRSHCSHCRLVASRPPASPPPPQPATLVRKPHAR